MSLLATRADFEPADSTEGASALYYQPADGSGYRADYPFFQVRAGHLKKHQAPAGQKVAIWGCGWGSLVKLAVEAGYDAYGFDGSSYAIERGRAVHPEIAARLFLRDATTATDVDLSRADAGLHGQARFALLVTEDMLSCMPDAEIAIALSLLRGAGAALVHVVTPAAGPEGARDARLNWKPQDEWASLVAPDALVDATDTMA